MIPLKGLQNKNKNVKAQSSISKTGSIVKHFDAPVVAKGNKDEIKNILSFLKQRYRK